MSDDSEFPMEYRWLTAEQVGKMLGYETRVIRERIACQPGFPKPVRIGGIRNPRWNAAEVHQWMLEQRERTVGRPRQSSLAATSARSG